MLSRQLVRPTVLTPKRGLRVHVRHPSETCCSARRKKELALTVFEDRVVFAGSLTLRNMWEKGCVSSTTAVFVTFVFETMLWYLLASAIPRRGP